MNGRYAFSLLLEGCKGARFAWTEFHQLKSAEELGRTGSSKNVLVRDLLAWQQKGLRTSLTRVAGNAKMAAIKMCVRVCVRVCACVRLCVRGCAHAHCRLPACRRAIATAGPLWTLARIGLNGSGPGCCSVTINQLTARLF